MALLKLSGIVTKISGKLGGNILGTSASGSYIKSNSYSQQHATQNQSFQRTRVQIFTQHWRLTSSSQKDAWAAAVSDYPYTNNVGDVVYYTAYQLFCKLNANLLQIGQSLILSPPTYTAPPIQTLTLNTLTSTDVILNINNGANGFTNIIYATKPYTNGQAFKECDLRYIGSTFSSTSTVITNQSINYFNVFRVFETGDNIYWVNKAVNQTSGIVTVPTSPLLTVIP